MKVLLVVVFVALSAVAFSQNNKIGVSVSGSYTSQSSKDYTPTLTKTLWSTTPDHPPIFRDQPVKEVPKYGYKVSVDYERTINNKLSLFSGITYAYSGFKINEERLLFRSQYMYDHGYVLPALESYSKASFDYNYYQIGIPVGANYFIPLKKIKIIAGAGILTNYLLPVKYSQTMYAREGTVVEEKTEDKSLYRKINASALVQVGVQINLNKHYTLRFTQQFQYTFTNIASKNAGFKVHPYAAGAGVSVFRSL